MVVMRDLDIGPRPTTIITKYEILGVIMQDMEVGLKISTTHPCSMLDKLLMALGEADIGFGPSLIPTTR